MAYEQSGVMVTESRSLSPPLIGNKEKAPIKEIDVLYSRIDQQVELINVLKQRLDEMTKRWERSEAEIEQQELDRSKLKASYTKASERCATLEIRWVQLSENHKEMIVLKDDYKERCRVLSDKLKKYEAGESAAIAAEQRRFEKLSKTLNEMKLREEKQLSYEITLHEKIKGLDARVSDLITRESTLSCELREEQSKHSAVVAEFEEKARGYEERMREEKLKSGEMDQKLDDLTQQIIGRGKLVQEKEEHAKRLREERDKAREKEKKISAELATLKESVNSNRIVRELREELLDEREKFRKLQLESTLFKNAAKEQLEKEKSVNAELRHVTSFSRGRNRSNNNDNCGESVVEGASG